MPFLRPSFTELRQQALNDLMTAPGGDGMGLLRHAVSNVLSWAFANLATGHYGHLDWIAKQAVPFTASGEYLEAWLALVGITRKPATMFVGTGVWTGSAGALLPVGTAVTGPGSTAYVTLADATVAIDGSVSAPITAALAGIASNRDVGDRLTLTGAVSGVNGAGLLAGIARKGADTERDDPFRTRGMARWAAPPQGGDAADYLEWALEVPGVTRAWAKPLGAGAGSVVIYTMWDDVEAARAGFPQGTNGVATAETRDVPAAGDQLAVANALYPLRPVTALVYSVAPLPYGVNFVIHPKAAVSATTRAAVVAAIDAVFLVFASPLADEMELSSLEAAIAAVPGMPSFTMTAPIGPVIAPVGYLPIRGSVTYA